MKNHGNRGFSLIEMLAFTFVMALVTIGVVTLTLSAARSADRQSAEATIVSYGRMGLDDTLREARAAKNIEYSRTIGGTTFTTNATTTLVVCAPSFDSTGILDNKYDYVAYRYNSANRRLSKSVSPAAGSLRAATSGFVIAKQVQSLALTYRVREQFDYKGSNQFVIHATPSTTPQAYVNGTAVACTYVAPLTYSVSGVTSTSDVQIFYTVTPTASTLPFVTGIDMTLTLSTVDGRNITRTMALTGSARLRNRRV